MSLTLYQLAPSPNSVKIRLAFTLKGIPHERIDIDPQDRSKIIELSGQELVPILTHDDRVIYDSYAIMRYLDANWPDSGPRLFSNVREKQQEIERWEIFTRTRVGACVGMIFGQYFAPERSEETIRSACEMLAALAPEIESALDSNEYLMGADPNAADLTAASFVALGRLDPARFEAGSIQAFFAESLRLPDSFTRTIAWVERVMALDT